MGAATQKMHQTKPFLTQKKEKICKTHCQATQFQVATRQQNKSNKCICNSYFFTEEKKTFLLRKNDNNFPYCHTVLYTHLRSTVQKYILRIECTAANKGKSIAIAIASEACTVCVVLVHTHTHASKYNSTAHSRKKVEHFLLAASLLLLLLSNIFLEKAKQYTALTGCV